MNTKEVEIITQEVNDGRKIALKLFRVMLNELKKINRESLGVIQVETAITGLADLYLQYVNDCEPEYFDEAKANLINLISMQKRI